MQQIHIEMDDQNQSEELSLNPADTNEQTYLNAVNAYIHSEGDLNNTRDIKGNSFLHIAVDNNFKKVAKLLLEHETDALTENNEGKSAIDIAIEKENDEISALIVRNMKQADIQTLMDKKKNYIKKNIFIENNCKLKETLLAVLNSLKVEQKDGSLQYDTKLLEEDNNGNVPGDKQFNYKDHTVFHVLAEKEHKEALNHTILRLLVNNKWKKWARKKFIVNFLLYLLSLFSLTFSAAVAATAADVKVYDTSLQRSRAAFEIVTYAFMLKGIGNEILQARRHRFVYCRQLLNWLELISVVLLLSVLPLRYINTRAHWYFFAVGYLLWVVKIFKYAVVFSGTGAYAESLRQILRRNVIPFSMLFCIVNLAFGGTFLLVLKGDDDLDTHEETSTIWEIWYVGLRTVIEAQPIVDYTGPEGYRLIGTFVMLTFMAIAYVVLLNILIAQLTETYHAIQSDARKSDVVNRAWIVARLERNASQWIYGQKNREKTFSQFLPGKDLHIPPKRSPPIEKISATVATIENRLITTDLKIQTVKTRLRLINNKLDAVQNQIKEIKDQLQLSHRL